MLCAETNTCVDTLTALLAPYANKGYHVYMDNFYNSIRLTHTLLELSSASLEVSDKTVDYQSR
jgi:hypothetical protein